MKRTIKTESGSIYEADSERHAIRRVSATSRSGHSVRATSQWRRYDSYVCQVGHPMTIEWGSDTPLLDSTEYSGVPFTVTSPVVEIKETE